MCRRRCRAGPGRAGQASQGKARQGKARQGKARQGKARQASRQVKSRKRKARQSKSSQATASKKKRSGTIQNTDLVKREANLLGDVGGASRDGDVLEVVLASLAERGCLHGDLFPPRWFRLFFSMRYRTVNTVE